MYVCIHAHKYFLYITNFVKFHLSQSLWTHQCTPKKQENWSTRKTMEKHHVASGISSAFITNAMANAATEERERHGASISCYSLGVQRGWDGAWAELSMLSPRRHQPHRLGYSQVTSSLARLFYSWDRERPELESLVAASFISAQLCLKIRRVWRELCQPSVFYIFCLSIRKIRERFSLEKVSSIDGARARG